MFTTPFAFMAAVSAGGDADATAYLAAVVAAGGTVTPTITTATNTLFTDLKTAGLYTKIPYFYPMLGSTATSNAIMGNRTFGTTYDLTYNGTITHSASGITKTSDISTDDFCDTHVVPLTNLSLTSFHISSYMNVYGGECCGYHGAGPGPYIALRQPYRQIIFGDASNDGGYGDGACFSIGSRTAANVSKSYDRSAITPFTQYGGTQTGAQNSLPSNSITIFHINGISGFSANGTIAFFTIGEGLNDGECAVLDTIINTFNTSLGRNF